MHIFLRRDPRYCRFVHAYGLGNVVQYQRFHGFITIFQKSSLMLDYASRHFHQSFIPALQAFQKPARFL